jgi:uncharacterized protein (DUF2235 family)
MINLFYNYYTDKNKDRQKEIDFCLEKNLSNQFINTIIIESQSKLSFNDYFNKINLVTTLEDINIICNSDIYLDQSIINCLSIKSNECFALSRWDTVENKDPIFYNHPDSQDTWIFKGKIKDIYGNILLGTPGCDNRISYEIEKAGYVLSNPSKKIKTYHVHLSNIRNYNPSEDRVPGPYKVIHPT